MSPKLDIGDALRFGADRVLSRGGAKLVVAYVFLQVAIRVVSQSLAAPLLRGTLPPARVARAYPLAVDLPAAVSGGLFVVVALLGTTFGVVAIRALYADVDRVPTGDHLRRLGRTTAVAVVVSVLLSVAVVVGTALLIVPGVFLAVSFVFAMVAVAVEDAGVVEAFRRSWTLTGGNRLRLFALGLLLAVVIGVTSAVFGAVGILAPVAGELGAALVTGVGTLLGMAVLVGSYRQLAAVDAPTSG